VAPAWYESPAAMHASKPSRARRWAHGDAALSLDARGRLRVAVVADTHGRPHPAAAQRIAELGPDAILHAGDIGARGVLDDFAKIAPVIAVRGNIDERASDLPDSVAIDVRADGESVLRLLLMHIAVYGPRLRADAARLATRHAARVVVCGHSHVPFVGRDRGLTVFNPGSIGPRRFHLPIVLGVLEIDAGKLALRHVDCESGATWKP